MSLSPLAISNGGSTTFGWLYPTILHHKGDGSLLDLLLAVGVFSNSHLDRFRPRFTDLRISLLSRGYQFLGRLRAFNLAPR